MLRRRMDKHSLGLSSLEKESDKCALEMLGGLSRLRASTPRSEIDEFDKDAVSARRTAARPCWERHPGLCRSLHKDLGIANIVRLGRSLYRVVRSAPVGESLFIVDGLLSSKTFLWLAFELAKPQTMLFAVAESSTPVKSGKEIFRKPMRVKCCKPLRFMTMYEVARIMTEQSVGFQEWQVHRVAYKEIAHRPSLCSVLATAVISTHKASSQVVIKTGQDPFEQALKDCIKPSNPVPVRRHTKKSAAKRPSGELSSDSDMPNDDDDDESVASLHGKDEPEASSAQVDPVVRTPPPSSYFTPEKDLGLQAVVRATSGRAFCRICSGLISKGAIRGQYAWHSRRPHGWVHLDCVPQIEHHLLQRCCAHRS